jgi:hypothetical protein
MNLRLSLETSNFAKVLLSDNEESTLKLIKENIELNSIPSEKVSIRKIDWRVRDEELDGTFSLAVATDVTFVKEFCPFLFATAFSLLKHGSYFLMCNGKWRYFPDVVRKSAIDNGFVLVSEKELRLDEVETKEQSEVIYTLFRKE